MNFGDIVVPIGDKVLACGSGRYDNAIVLSMEPFALVSKAGDMRWGCTVEEKDFKTTGVATLEEMEKVIHRLLS